MRVKRTSGNKAYTYIYNGDMLRYMEYDSNTTDNKTPAKLYFTFDASGLPISVNYTPENSTTNYLFYYVHNLQGDVEGLLHGTTGNVSVWYSYDAWGNTVVSGRNTEHPGTDTLININPFRYRSYVYDSETGLYYLQSRYYDPEMGRFINADDTAYLGADGTLLSYNLFTYCKNNPVMGYDPTGHFGLVGAIIATGAIVGGLLGAFSAATTGGNVLESAIEGCLTGALGAACGILISNPIVAVGLAALGGSAIDFTTQVTTQYIENKSVDLSSVDYGRVAKTGIQTGIGTAIPAFGEGAGNAVDAFGTALIWAEASTMIVCTDVVVTNTIAAVQSSSRRMPRIGYSVAIHEREMLLN